MHQAAPAPAPRVLAGAAAGAQDWWCTGTFRFGGTAAPDVFAPAS